MEALTHWGRDEIDTIWQMTFSDAFLLNQNAVISIMISLKFIPKGPINNIPALFQIIAWRWIGDKPLYEPMMVSLLIIDYYSDGTNHCKFDCLFNSMFRVIKAKLNISVSLGH